MTRSYWEHAFKTWLTILAYLGVCILIMLVAVHYYR